jgi:UDP-glucose 4-epimerase
VSAALAWVVGRGGLLGRHVEQALRETDANVAVWTPTRSTRWQRLEDAAEDLGAESRDFFDAVRQRGCRWRILWCAGGGVIATAPSALARETGLVGRFLDSVGEALRREPQLTDAGLLFFASSAGAVYAASGAPLPFDESSPVGALGAYGEEKLEQEQLFRSAGEAFGVDVLIGRFSNLYGPGQDLSKPQGLVAHVGRAALLRETVSIYVPLDTIRDYLFAEDAGRMVTRAVDRFALDAGRGRVLTKIFASEIDVTVASVLAAWRQALRRPLRVALAANPVAQLQPRALSFRSRVWPDLLGLPTQLPLGIDALRRDQLARLMAGELR